MSPVSEYVRAGRFYGVQALRLTVPSVVRKGGDMERPRFMTTIEEKDGVLRARVDEYGAGGKTVALFACTPGSTGAALAELVRHIGLKVGPDGLAKTGSGTG